MATNTQHSNQHDQYNQHLDTTPEAKAIKNDLAQTWYTFEQIAHVAAAEAKQYGDGQPRAETTLLLDALSDRLAQLEAQLGVNDVAPGSLVPSESTGELMLNGQRYEYQKGTAEQARFIKCLRGGLASLPEWGRDRVRLADPQWLEDHKAMTQMNDTTGGYLAAPEFAADLLRALQETSPVRQVATVHLTGGTGALVPVRSGIQTASRVSETGTRVATSGDLGFKLDQVPVHEMYTLTALSHALLQDSHYPLDRELVNGASAAFALLEGQEFISGDGNGKFLGLNSTTTLPTANKVVCADATGHLVTPDDILKLVYKSMAAPYIAGGRLLLNPVLLGTLRMLRATSGNTFLAPVQDAPNTFMGIPFTLMPDLADNATPAAGNIVAYFLNPMAYAVVVREDVVVQRMVERFADEGKVGYAIYSRTGGQIVLPEAVARLTTA